MGRKKRNHPSLDELVNRPFCYYCEREFDDQRVLLNHQKAKHFKCERCNRRLNTAGGLAVHMNQVHKETLTHVENALPNRQGLDLEIFAMEGVPPEIVEAHKRRVIEVFYQQQQERSRITGNPPPGQSSGSHPSKRLKMESTEEILGRVAEHVVAIRAAKVTTVNVGEVTAMGAQSPPVNQSQVIFPSGSPSLSHQPAFSSPQGNPLPPAFAQPDFPQSFPQQQPAGYGGPGQTFTSGSSGFSPPQYSQAGGSQTQIPYHQGGAPQLRGGSPSAQHRSSNLPTATGLPQRPTFGTPNVSSTQLQQMHQGQIPVTHSPTQTSVVQPLNGTPASGLATPIEAPASNNTTDKPESLDKKTSNKKEKNNKLVYTDNATSPEEKMARLPKYAFCPDHTGSEMLGALGQAVPSVVSDI